MRFSERSSVDLPQPDGPIIAVISREGIANDTSCTATASP